MGFFGSIGRFFSAPFRAVGNLVTKGVRSVGRYIGDLASTAQKGGVGKLISKIGGDIGGVAKKVASLPIIKDTPIGRIAQGITSVGGLSEAIQKGDLGKAVSVGKDLAGQIGELKGARGAVARGGVSR